jgi:hypothetical protein
MSLYDDVVTDFVVPTTNNSNGDPSNDTSNNTTNKTDTNRQTNDIGK